VRTLSDLLKVLRSGVGQQENPRRPVSGFAFRHVVNLVHGVWPHDVGFALSSHSDLGEVAQDAAAQENSFGRAAMAEFVDLSRYGNQHQRLVLGIRSENRKFGSKTAVFHLENGFYHVGDVAGL